MQQNHDRLVLFDLAVGGHHGTYLWHFVNYWNQHNVPATLNLVVAPNFAEQHGEVVDLIQQNSSDRIHLFPISPDELAKINRQRSLIARTFAEWEVFCHYAAMLQATQGLLMYFDALQLPLAFGKKSPCPVSGIYFRPTFHYAQFENFRRTRKEAIRQWRQKFLLKLILRSRQFNSLFSLDPYAVQAIERLSSSAKAFHLPDPVAIDSTPSISTADLRLQLGIEPDRKVLLLFGRISGRKGVYKLLESVQHLSAKTCEKICLLIVGQIPDSERERIYSQIAAIEHLKTTQVILHEQYVAESEVSAYFQLADLVLAPYQQHVGMSGILLQAAAAKRPVLSSNYGLMGKLTQTYQLGLAIRAEDPQEIAQGIEKMLNSPTQALLNAEKMDAFVQLNLAEKFAETLVSQLVQDALCVQPNVEDLSHAQTL